MDTLEQGLSGDGYIAGDRFSAADVYCGSHIGWGLQFNTIDNRPTFSDYWARIKDREALKRAAEFDDALVPESSN